MSRIKVIKKIFLLAVLFFAAASCDTEEDIDYNYYVDNIFWSDVLDGNQDGYVQFKRLNFSVFLIEEVTRNIQARIYYKPQDASTFSLYAITPETEVTGGETENRIFYSIGTPNKELTRDFYDFSIEIYEVNKNRLEAQTDSQFTELYNNKFEESGNDNSCFVNFWWSNSYDRDANTYWRHATMNINVYSNNTYNKKVDVKVFYKKSAEETYKLFQTKSDYSVKGELEDTLKYVFGLPELKLTYDQYDFRIEVYRSDINTLVAFKDPEDPLLNDIEFESDEEDSYHYSFSNVWWSNSVDVDGDQFTHFRELNFDVDVVEDEDRIVYAKVFYLHPDSTDYTLYDSTSYFTVRGITNSDKYKVSIGPTKTELDSNLYNIMISIYEIVNISDRSVELSTSGDNDTLLFKQKFETFLQDTLK